jgi:hypothetical protein
MVTASQTSSRREQLVQLLSYAYNAFLRLHCSVEYLTKWSQATDCFKVPEIDTFLCAFQDLKRDKAQSGMFEEIDLKAESEEAWLQKMSLLQAATAKCKVMFVKTKKRKQNADGKIDQSRANITSVSDQPKKKQKQKDRVQQRIVNHDAVRPS